MTKHNGKRDGSFFAEIRMSYMDEP